MPEMLDINPENGFLRRPSFHDGYLTGLLVEEGRATVLLKTIDNELYRLELGAVQRLIANSFQEGNIVSHIEIITRREPMHSHILELFGVPHPSVEVTHHQQHAEYVAKAAESVSTGQAVVVAITSSYGCNFTALCGNVALHPIPRGSML